MTLKVVTATEMGRIEGDAYADGESDSQFMFEAGMGVADAVHDLVTASDLEWEVTLVCGKGNNAGDAYVAGSSLISRGYKARALRLHRPDSCSLLCRERAVEFENHGGQIVDVFGADDLAFLECGVVIDGLLGTGFHGDVIGLYADAITRINEAKQPVVAVDIPSGVNGNTGEVAHVAVKADTTVFLGLPKTGFFLSHGWDYMGELAYVDFGLPKRNVRGAKTDMLLPTEEDIAAMIPEVVRSRHKYQAGYVVGLSGSVEMPGAGILAGYSALKAGAGIVRIFFPDGTHLDNCPPELITEHYSQADQVIQAMEKASAVLIGPGLGASPETAALVQKVLETTDHPCVLDADGLNLLALHPQWRLPEQVVLTPHAGEMHRLLGISKLEQPPGVEWLKRCQEYAVERQVTLVLKGAPTFVFDHQGEVPYVIPRGDPGMATAGSGDVLTGIIAANLAQGVAPVQAAVLGTYLHGIAGEMAAAVLTSYSLSASDLIDYLPHAFHLFNQ